VRHFDVGPHTVQNVCCNPIEQSVIAACGADRAILLLDSRQKVPLTKVVLKLRSNSIVWHPLESFTFTAANEDYKFDLIY
jgi:DDB1- and CUL4-associated factor 13